jgi:hypothetical protein
MGRERVEGKGGSTAWRTFLAILAVVTFVLLLAIPSNLGAGVGSSPSAASPVPGQSTIVTSGLASWNPNVTCSADQVTVADILGRAYPSEALAGSRYQVNATAGGVPSKRALHPPCTITNVTGKVVSSFVQVNRVYLYDYLFASGDCSKGFKPENGGGPYPNGQTFCDNTGDIRAMGTTNGYIHIEFDQDWLAKGYCGATVPSCNNVTIAKYVSAGNISLDLQGFVFWDANHWEFHPLSAWRLTPPPPPPDFGMSSNPASLSIVMGSSGTSAITLTSLNGFSGNVGLTASVACSGVCVFPPTATLNPTTVTLAANGSGSSTLTVSTFLGTIPGTYTVTVTATSGSIKHSTAISVTVRLPP